MNAIAPSQPTCARTSSIFSVSLVLEGTGASKLVRRIAQVVICAAGLVLLAPAVSAQTPAPLEATLVVLKPGVGPDGKPGLVAATAVEPGQVLTYRVTYRNRGTGELKAVAASLPVPAGLSYEVDSALPAAVSATLDGTTFFPVATPPKDTTPAAWRVLRWSPRPLAPGAEFTVELRARVVTAAPAPVSAIL